MKKTSLRTPLGGPLAQPWSPALFPAALLLFAAVIAYENSFGGAFLFDDVIHIVENERIRRLWPPWALLAVERPVVEVSLAINYALGELRPWGYHAFNLAVHVLAGLTLFGVVRRTMVRVLTRRLKDTGVAGDASPRRLKPAARNATDSSTTVRHSLDDDAAAFTATWTAWAIALLFLVHPLQTQSVTYVIQRGESMMGLFYLLTLYAFIRGVDSPRRGWWFAGSIAACALGMATKAVMVTAPVMVLLYDGVFVHPRGSEGNGGPRGAKSTAGGGPPVACAPGSDAPRTSRDAAGPVADAPGSYRAALWRRWGLYVGLAATWSVLWWCGIAPAVLGRSDDLSHVGFSYRGVTPLTYAAAQPGVIVKYLQLSFWPASLCLDYAWPTAATWRQIVPPAIVIAILLAATGRALWRRSRMGLTGAWFFVILAPTSSVVPIKDLMFEHRMYLPLAAVIALTVIALRTVLHELCMRARLSALTRRAAATVLLLNAVVPLTYGTIRRNMDYADDLRMWKDVIAKRPDNARAYVAVGNALAARDRIDEAVEVTREATSIDPDDADGHCALGIVLIRQGRPEEAINAYREAVRHNPLHAKAWYNLGNVLDSQGRYDEAVDAYTNSIDAYSGFADVHCNLGNTLVRQGRIDDGVEAFRKTLAIDPRHVKGHNNLGDALVKLGRLDEATAEFEMAIRLQPDYAKARINLALVRVTQQLYAEAIEQCEAVLRLDPNNPTAQDVLAKARAADDQQ
jgi:tetratricopeptide (TPR) repeat protein